MIRMENHLGTIEISESYFSSLVGNAASSCFGVVGMANSNARQGIRSFFNRRRSFPDQGVAVRKEGDGLAIDLHIIVTYGSISLPLLKASSIRCAIRWKRRPALKCARSMCLWMG